ncbi:MAG: response regulator [Pyrinomonadaceae bacterium]
MVIDDTPAVADMLSFMLRSSGYEVVAFSQPRIALAAARQERFDIVISDIGMPGMNGYDLAVGLRRLPAYSAVPLVAVTGFSGLQ